MLLFDRHRRFRERLSGYIDGQVNGREKAALETHLASCERCRTELAQLHSVRTILHSLPPVQAPRSFRLTPQQVAPVARPRPIAASPALNAVRLAGAVAAVALTIVVFADRSDVFESGTTNEAARPAGNAEMLSQATDKAARENATNGGAAPSAAFGQPSVAPPPPASPLAGARPPASPSPALQNLDSDQGQQAAPPASASPSSGNSAVRIIEALLAAVLGIAIGGTLVLTAARRLGQ